MGLTRRIWWGIGLIVAGLFFLAGSAGILDPETVTRVFWPALLILCGILLLVRRRTPGGQERMIHDKPSGDPFHASDQINSSTVFGDSDFSLSSTAFRGGFISKIFGNARVNLSTCKPAEGEQELRISSVFGDAEVLLPRNEACAVHASTLFGSLAVQGQQRDGFSSTLTYESPGFAVASRKLRIHVSQVFGNIRVRE